MAERKTKTKRRTRAIVKTFENLTDKSKRKPVTPGKKLAKKIKDMQEQFGKEGGTSTEAFRKRANIRDVIERESEKSLEQVLKDAGLNTDVIENLIKPHKSTMTAAKNRARIKSLQKRGKKSGGKVMTGSQLIASLYD